MSLERTKRLIQDHHITMKAGEGRRTGDGGTIYRITLFYQGRQITIPSFYFGPAYSEPDIGHVLEAFLDDAASIENNPTREQWLREYESWDEDQYKDCLQQTEKFKRFLGDEYETFLWEP